MAKKRLPTLRTVEGIQHNLERLFREARRGEVDVADASKLAYMLKILFDMKSYDEIEQRLERLEDEYARSSSRPSRKV